MSKMANKRLIDANSLENQFMFLRKMWCGTEILSVIDQEPTVDAVEVVHGRWIMTLYTTTSKRGRVISNQKFACSVCGYGNGRKQRNYCPNCGAKMGSDGSAAGGRRSDQSEWQRSADDEAALAARKMSGTATGLGGNEDA